MAYEDKPELLVADESDPAMTEVSALAHGLLLDAAEPFDFTEPTPSGPIDRRVDYALDANRTSDGRSRHIGIGIDQLGVQVAMFSFSEESPFTVPADQGEPIEILPPVDTGDLLSVDFFSYVFEPAGVRLEGVECDAEAENIEDLIVTMRHPDLEELAEARQVVRHSAITLDVIRMMSAARADAQREFFIRKEVEIMNWLAENEVKLEERVKLEGDIASLQARIADNEWKIAHPVRGVLKEFFERFRRN